MIRFRKTMFLVSGSPEVLFVNFSKNTNWYHTKQFGKANLISLFLAASSHNTEAGSLWHRVYMWLYFISGFAPKWNRNYICIIISFVSFLWPVSLTVFWWLRLPMTEWQHHANFLVTYRVNFFFKSVTREHKCRDWIPTCKVNRSDFHNRPEPLNRKSI